MIVLSTDPLHSYSIKRIFALAAETGFDGIEVIIGRKLETRDPIYLRGLSSQCGLPIVAIHTCPSQKFVHHEIVDIFVQAVKNFSHDEEAPKTILDDMFQIQKDAVAKNSTLCHRHAPSLSDQYESQGFQETRVFGDERQGAYIKHPVSSGFALHARLQRSKQFSRQCDRRICRVLQSLPDMVVPEIQVDDAPTQESFLVFEASVQPSDETDMLQ